MFEHEQLLAQHKEACVMGWRRRSGNLIALRAEEGREERGDRLLQLAWPVPSQTRARQNTHTHRDCSVRKSTILWLRHEIRHER